MAYEPLHHKYRPQTFKDLIGQEAIASTLINALAREKIAPAYLFTGPRGTGKTSSARILAKSLNCLATDKPTATPCGKCEVCTAIAASNALDVIEIDAASNTGVDNIREIIERSRFAPVQARYKVYAIDECHMLSTAAFNALLKTLEEPPPRVVFILATTDPQRVLSTIISRCQRFDYRRIPLKAMVNHLDYIAKEEEIRIAPEALTLTAQIANGGLRDAESLLDQLSLFPDIITVDRVWDLVGAVPERDLLGLLTAIRNQDIEQILAQCRNLLDRGREPLVLLQNLASFYLNLLLAKTAPNRQDLVAVTETCWQQLCTEAQHWQTETILRGQQQLKEGEVQLKHTTQPRLWLEVILLGLLNQAMVTENTATPKTIPPAQPSVGKSNEITPPAVMDNAIAKVANTTQKSIPQETIEQKPAITQPQPAIAKNSPREAAKVTETSVQPSSNVAGSTQRATVQRSQRETTNSREQAAAPISSSISSEEQTAIWQQVMDCIHPPMTQALLRQHCHLIRLNDSSAIVGISSAPLQKMNQNKVPNIEAAFAKVCQRKIKVTLEVAKAQKETITKPKESTVRETHFQNPTTQARKPIQPASNPQEVTTVREKKPPVSNPMRSEIPPKVAPEIKPQQETLLQSRDREIAPEDRAIKTEQNPSSFDNPPAANENNFTKAVELVAQKFDGEIIDLKSSATTPSQLNTETPVATPQQPRVIVRREISEYDYDDDDVPF